MSISSSQASQASQAPAIAGAKGAPAQSLEVLQAQIADQGQQLGVLTAQRRVIQNQIYTTPPSALRSTLEAQKQALDEQILKLQVDMAATRAQFAGRLGIPVERIGPTGRLAIPTAPDFAPRRGPDPDAIVAGSFVLAISIALPLSIAYARRIWRGRGAMSSAQSETITPRLDRLEQAVDAIAIEIERVAEGQRFVTKVLAERPAATPQSQPVSGDPIRREASPGLGEGKPFLALGAGPIEPIRVAERQAVRPSITPH